MCWSQIFFCSITSRLGQVTQNSNPLPEKHGLDREWNSWKMTHELDGSNIVNQSSQKSGQAATPDLAPAFLDVGCWFVSLVQVCLWLSKKKSVINTFFSTFVWCCRKLSSHRSRPKWKDKGTSRDGRWSDRLCTIQPLIAAAETWDHFKPWR